MHTQQQMYSQALIGEFAMPVRSPLPTSVLVDAVETAINLAWYDYQSCRGEAVQILAGTENLAQDIQKNTLDRLLPQTALMWALMETRCIPMKNRTLTKKRLVFYWQLPNESSTQACTLMEERHLLREFYGKMLMLGNHFVEAMHVLRYEFTEPLPLTSYITHVDDERQWLVSACILLSTRNKMIECLKSDEEQAFSMISACTFTFALNLVQCTTNALEHPGVFELLRWECKTRVRRSESEKEGAIAQDTNVPPIANISGTHNKDLSTLVVNTVAKLRYNRDLTTVGEAEWKLAREMLDDILVSDQAMRFRPLELARTICQHHATNFEMHSINLTTVTLLPTVNAGEILPL